MANEANKSEKRYRRIRKLHIWNSIVEFCLFTVICTVIIVSALYMFGSYIIDTKISAEYERIVYMERLYERSLKDNDQDIRELLDEEGRDYLIVDAGGNILVQHGEDTRSTESGSVILAGSNEPVLIYRDSSRNYVYPAANGRLMIDFVGFARWMESDEDIEEKDIDDAYLNRHYINLPVWISVNMEDGSYFVGKALFSTNRRDVMLFTALVVSIVALAAIILLTILIAGIRNFIRQRRMISLFFTDVATDGHNHTWLLVRGERMLRKKSSERNRFAVVDLQFTNYNTFCICHSVPEGEKILGTIYRKLNAVLNHPEMCAHNGAADFGLILNYTDEPELRSRLQALVGELENVDKDHHFYYHVGVMPVDKAVDSEGNPVRRKDLDLDTLYNNATAARLSLGTGDDSGIAFYDEKLTEEQKWLDQVQEHQQAALDNEEFVVYYQPKYDPKTNELRGAEALIRWEFPDLGLISPGRFIPIFEKNGFITEIDHYMIRHVAADQKAWLDRGLPCVPVSVNVSRAHFIESDLAEQIRDMVDLAGTPHNYIEIELTESAFFDDKKALLSTINKLKEYGFAVSMDDFGSGYSSLNSLKDLPLDVLKLDAEFFRGDAADERGRIVVSEAIRLAKNLNMRIVAEGVEVREQVEFLAGEDCDMIQGYIFDKPMPGADYEQKMHPADAPGAGQDQEQS